MDLHGAIELTRDKIKSLENRLQEIQAEQQEAAQRLLIERGRLEGLKFHALEWEAKTQHDNHSDERHEEKAQAQAPQEEESRNNLAGFKLIGS